MPLYNSCTTVRRNNSLSRQTIFRCADCEYLTAVGRSAANFAAAHLINRRQRRAVQVKNLLRCPALRSSILSFYRYKCSSDICGSGSIVATVAHLKNGGAAVMAWILKKLAQRRWPSPLAQVPKFSGAPNSGIQYGIYYLNVFLQLK